jgi:UPF0755 protein
VKLGRGRLVVTLALVFTGVALLTGIAGWSALNRPYAGWEDEAVVVELESGLAAARLLDDLATAGVLQHPRLVRGWLALRGGAGRLQAGEYRFDRPVSAVVVVRRLERGDVLLHEVTIPEGLTLLETAARFSETGLAGYDALVAVFRDPTPIRDLDLEAEDLEGYLFPETYRFPRGESPRRIVSAMVAQFHVAVDGDYVARAAERDLTLRQAVALASMIEKEASSPDERTRISRVFHNRLARGMRLESDPTVTYAIERDGREVERLTYADLRYESPWNTYRVKGVPAGPIASPGRESLQAALQPAEGDELYFVASPEGGHRFSNDLDGHLRAVAEWRRYVRSSR